MALPHGAVGWSVVFDCGILIMLTFLLKSNSHTSLDKGCHCSVKMASSCCVMSHLESVFFIKTRN